MMRTYAFQLTIHCKNVIKREYLMVFKKDRESKGKREREREISNNFLQVLAYKICMLVFRWICLTGVFDSILNVWNFFMYFNYFLMIYNMYLQSFRYSLRKFNFLYQMNAAVIHCRYESGSCLRCCRSEPSIVDIHHPKWYLSGEIYVGPEPPVKGVA